MSNTLSAIKELRHAVVKAIKDAEITGIGDNVFEARREDVWPEEGLLAVVNTDSIKFDDKRTSPTEYIVSVNVVVDVVCQSESGAVNDSLDDTTAEIIYALQQPMPQGGYFGGMTKRFVVVGVENNLSELGEKNRGLQRITFETVFGVPMPVKIAVDDFQKANNTLVAAPGDGNKMEFTTVLQEPAPEPGPESDPDESETLDEVDDA